MTRRALRKLIASSVLAAVAATAAAPFASAADWPMFRGPSRDGVAPAGESAPLVWSREKNVKWKAALPRPGNSSPVVVGDRVFLATATDERGTQRSLICFDRKSGQPLWTKTVAHETPDPTHATNPYNAASPAVDKECVVVWHGSGGLFCYDHDGKELWKRDLGTIRHIWGWAGSPVIHGDAVFLNAGPGERQFVCAVDKRTGDVRWQTDDPGGAADKSPQTKNWLGSWSTPQVVEVGGREQVLVFMQHKVNAYDPKSGKVIWTVQGAGPLAYSDVYVSPPQPDGGRIGLALAGFTGAAIGFKVAPDASGDVTATHRLWQDPQKHPQRIGTGVILGDRVIVPNEPYIGCYDIKTGKEVWRHPIGGERFWGSIVQVGDRLYVTSQKGTTYVFAADPSGYKQLAKNELGEPSNSTPAVSDGELFIRTAGHLWCIGE